MGPKEGVPQGTFFGSSITLELSKKGSRPFTQFSSQSVTVQGSAFLIKKATWIISPNNQYQTLTCNHQKLKLS